MTIYCKDCKHFYMAYMTHPELCCYREEYSTFDKIVGVNKHTVIQASEIAERIDPSADRLNAHRVLNADNKCPYFKKKC